MLTEKQNEMINMLIEGKTKSDVIRELKIARQTLYNWLGKDEIIAEMDRRRQKMCKDALADLKGDTKELLAEVKKLAYTADSEAIRLQALNSLLDRTLGKATTKQEVSIEKTTEKDIDLKELEDTFNMVEDIVDDKVIDLKEKKAN